MAETEKKKDEAAPIWVIFLLIVFGLWVWGQMPWSSWYKERAAEAALVEPVDEIAEIYKSINKRKSLRQEAAQRRDAALLDQLSVDREIGYDQATGTFTEKYYGDKVDREFDKAVELLETEYEINRSLESR